jgi:hypothetical protein
LLLLICWVPEAALVGAWTAGLSLGMRCAWLDWLQWHEVLALIYEYHLAAALYLVSRAVATLP